MLSVIAGDAGIEQQNEVKPHSAVLVLLQQMMELEESTSGPWFITVDAGHCSITVENDGPAFTNMGHSVYLVLFSSSLS